MQYILRVSFLFSTLFFSYVAYCQQPDYITGKVIDSKTLFPVPFATLHLKNSQTGVISNADGDFRILNSPRFQSDSLIVSCIGFHRLSLAFSSLGSETMNKIKLRSYTYSLKEVRVTARKKRLNAEMIVRRAIRDITRNISDKPFSYVSYYRDYQKDSTRYINLNEAIIETLDNGIEFPPDSNRYRLLDFRKNTDFVRNKITPYYNIPETDHTNESYKSIPHAFVGDQNGNEFFVLLAHDPFRSYDKRTFSFVDTLSVDFVRNHLFSTPQGVYEGNTLLYKIDFTASRKIALDDYGGSIYIQPDDYSIHKLVYNGSYIDAEKKKKDIFNIEIEYGREPSISSKMCLKYISFNNTFIIPDSTDNDYFKLVKAGWWQLRAQSDPNVILAEFNHPVDPVSGKKLDKYNLSFGAKPGKIRNIRVEGKNVYLTITHENYNFNDTISFSVSNLIDINGHLLGKKKDVEYRQFRELFVQEYNKPIEFKNSCFIRSEPLEKNCISVSDTLGRFWMNTPLKRSELE
jgi:hypothetical protein